MFLLADERIAESGCGAVKQETIDRRNSKCVHKTGGFYPFVKLPLSPNSHD